MEKKVALITGGSRGIGKAIAEKFAKNGYDLVINYVSDNTDLEAIKEEFKQYGSEVLMEKADVSNYAECEKMVTSAIEKFGRIDVLVNNAGVTRDNLLMRMKEEDFDKVISINLKGTFNLTKLVTPYMMKRREGRIVSISSVVGVMGNAGQSNYAASKAGIIGFTKSVAKELASRNILANCVAPGFIATDMTAVLNDKSKYHQRQPCRTNHGQNDPKISEFLACTINPSSFKHIIWDSLCKLCHQKHAEGRTH